MNPELAQFEALGKDILRRVMAEEDPEEIRRWLGSTVERLGSGEGDNALLTWPDSFELMDAVLENYKVIANTPPELRRDLTWPWNSWNSIIDAPEEGMLSLITAPDGQGKTIYGESIAEHWAKHKNRVVFVHYELNRKLMMLRRTSRHTGITVRDLKSGMLNPLQMEKIRNIKSQLLEWDGHISYLHTPGWSMEQTIAELRKMNADDECDVIVLDYLEKASASSRQLKLFGTNIYQREADNVEQLKNFAETSGIPVVMIAQMSKAGKSTGFDNVDRTGIRGAGEKSDKANLVVLLKRERIEDGYSNEVDILVDKNTMGGTGTFRQLMQPEYFRVFDIAKGV
jgi:replicative DNA helicase